MIHCAVPVEVPHFQKDDGGFDLFLFGDRQEGAKGYVPEAWAAFRDEFRACKRKKLALGMGDYGDWLRPSLRPLVKGSMGKDDSARQMLDKMILKEHDTIVKAHDFLEGYMVGVHEGHHTWTTLDGINLDQRLASALRTRFLGFAATTRLVLRDADDSGKQRVRAHGGGDSYVVTMLSTHGNANGRKVAGALTWVENNLVNAFAADLYAIGHGCKSATHAPFERTEVRRAGPPGVKRMIPRVVAVGGFARGWTDGWSSDYVERAGMSPQPLGWARIRFRLIQRADNALAAGVKNHRSKTLDIEAANRFFTETQED